MDKFFWEFLEMESSSYKFYINNAKLPGFFLCPPFSVGSMQKSKWTLWMTGVTILGEFSSRKKALMKLKAFLDTALVPIRVHMVHRGNTTRFHEQLEQRTDLSKLKPGRPMRIFEKVEWLDKQDSSSKLGSESDD